MVLDSFRCSITITITTTAIIPLFHPLLLGRCFVVIIILGWITTIAIAHRGVLIIVVTTRDRIILVIVVVRLIFGAICCVAVIIIIICWWC